MLGFHAFCNLLCINAVLQIITAKRPGYQDIAEYYQQYLNNDYRNY
jgi:hypothetical protein